MASFREAFEKTMENEGGYYLHDVPGDRGGMTYAGISRRYHPHWIGWRMIDKGVVSKAALEPLVRSFYKEWFWDKINGSEMLNQGMADSIYDFAVNVGPRDSARLAQAIVEVETDGIIGPISLKALNTCNPDLFRIKFFVGKIAWYARICNKSPGQKKFLLGWVNRSLKEVKQ